MKALNKKPKVTKAYWAQFQLELHLNDQILYLHLKNTLNNRKFKGLYSELPLSLQQCNYSSLMEFYVDIQEILKSQKISKLQRLKIQNNGNIKILKKVSSLFDGKFKIGYLKTEEYFDQKDSKFNSIKIKNMIVKKTQAQILQIFSKISQQSHKIDKLQSQYFELKSTIEEFIKNSNIQISSLGQHTLRRKLFFKQNLDLLEKIQNVFIQGFFCDFYFKKNRLQMFLTNAQNGDQFFIFVEDNQQMIQIEKLQSSQKVYRQIKQFISLKNETQIDVKTKNLKNRIKISIIGTFTLQRFKLDYSGSQQINEVQEFKGEKIQCSPIQKLKKKLWLQRLKSEHSKRKDSTQMKNQFEIILLKNMKNICQSIKA